MKSLNRWQGIGRLGQNPELRATQSGQTVANFSLACQDDYKDQSGQKIERTEWVRVTLWGKGAEIFGRYTSKGSKVYVEGKLSTRKYQDRQGNDRYVTEVIADNFELLDGKPAGAAPAPPTGDQPAGRPNGIPAPSAYPDQAPAGDFPFDDDLPF